MGALVKSLYWDPTNSTVKGAEKCFSFLVKSFMSKRYSKIHFTRGLAKEHGKDRCKRKKEKLLHLKSILINIYCNRFSRFPGKLEPLDGILFVFGYCLLRYSNVPIIARGEFIQNQLHPHEQYCSTDLTLVKTKQYFTKYYIKDKTEMFQNREKPARISRLSMLSTGAPTSLIERTTSKNGLMALF